MASEDYLAYSNHQEELYGIISLAVSNLKRVGTANITRHRILARLDSLRGNWGKFQENHLALIKIKSLAETEIAEEIKSSPYFSTGMYSLCEEVYLDAQADMTALLDDFQAPIAHNGSGIMDASTVHERPNLSRRILRIELPKFNGDYCEWTTFRDLFVSLIGSNMDLTCVEKLQHLKLSLTGTAAQKLKNVAVTADNFKPAWDTLVEYYENKRVLIDTYLSSLFSIRKLTRESAQEIEHLSSQVTQALDALQALQRPVEHWDDLIVHFTVRKLDPISVKEWEREMGTRTDPPRCEELKKFLIGRVRSLQAYERTIGISSRPKGKESLSAKAHHTAIQPIRECVICSAQHYVSSCPNYQTKTLTQRREIVNRNKLCFNCLGPHQLKVCRSTKRCQICKAQHHTSLHQEKQTATVPAASAIPQVTSNTPSTPAAVNATVTASASDSDSTARSPPVLLPTAVVKVASVSGELVDARVFLDQGAEISLVTECLAQRLRLPRSRASIPIVGMGGGSARVTHGVVELTVSSRVVPTFSCKVKASILPRLTGRLPSVEVPKQNYSHLEGLQLADPGYFRPGRIDIVLGASIYAQILENEIVKESTLAPIAQRTKLGWIISGETLIEPTQYSAVAKNYQCSVDRELHGLLQRFWLQEEEFVTSKEEPSQEERDCEAHFVATHTRDATGRYIVRLPLKRSLDDLGDSRISAARMLARMETRFAREPKLQESYSKFLSEYEDLGHMCRGPVLPFENQRVFYLPHHGVVRDCSSTTKLRVVFNGSQRTPGGLSLNDCLHTGPKILADLSDVIFRWRQYRYVFSADIEKMFRQIRVHPADWDLQRILWKPSTEKTITEYQLCTVTYGLACAPFLATRTLHQLTQDEGVHYPLAVNAIVKETYVDNVFSGADTIERGLDKLRQVDLLLAAGGFPLTQWVANDKRLLAEIPEARQASVCALSFEDEPQFRALGLSWKLRDDSFGFTTNVNSDCSVYTKRAVLSRTAQLFDPLGWLAPVTVRAKIFLQDLWEAELGWDDALPDSLTHRWKEFLEQLPLVADFSVPRWMGLSSSNASVELHGFSDASHAALGAVIYLRVVDEAGDIRVSLVSAKTKVAPRKSKKTGRARSARITTPRLELSAAVLLVRHISRVRKTLLLDAAPVHLWTDSSITMYWVRGQPSRWKDFVRNRVASVQECLPDARWHHVPGEDNPADCASRGLAPKLLGRDHIWWNGPTWLKQHSRFWPAGIPHLDEDIDLEERQKIVAITREADIAPMWDLIDRFSNFDRLMRITALCKRFVARLQGKLISCGDPLTPSELSEARNFWVKTVQQAHFAPEIKILTNGKMLSPSNALARFVPFLDKMGLLRVGGRLRNSLLDPDMKHPLILPRESSLTTLIIREAHRATLHGGTQSTLSTLRRSYWILGGRVPVRSFILRCVRCARHRAVTAKQLMGQLPSLSAIPSRPFYHSGVDYAGPFTLKTWRGRAAKTYKGYIVLFVCLVSSAIHLELVTDYSTEGFIAAFKRFTGRRGICKTLSSDCGKNLIGADNELRKLFDAASREIKHLANLLANDGTEWRFNPPSAPHFGGKWEAGVKAVKFHLKRVIGDAILTYEEYSTLLISIEAVLNSRPLCPLSDDPADVDALTPGHFLIGAPLTTAPEPSLLNIKESRLSRYQLQRKLLESFWKRWSTEYLQRFQATTKWHRSTNAIQVGTLVLVSDERYPPSKWPLARVVAVHPGSDGLVRVATVRTQTSTYMRPIVKLCPLPIPT